MCAIVQLVSDQLKAVLKIKLIQTSFYIFLYKKLVESYSNVYSVVSLLLFWNIFLRNISILGSVCDLAFYPLILI